MFTQVRASLFRLLLTVLLLVCGCDEAEVQEAGSREPSAALESLVVEPSSLRLAQGTGSHLKAVGHFNDGSIADLTNEVAWTTAPSGHIVLSAEGEVNARFAGEVQVQATLAGVSANASVAVTEATLVGLQMEEPEEAALSPASTAEYRVVGFFSDGSQQELTEQAVFRVEDGQVATTDGGHVRVLNGGQTTLTASYEGMRAQSLVSVQATKTLNSIRLTPSSVSFPKGITQNFKATGVYSDGTTRDLTSLASWRSSNATVVTVTAGGLATGVKAGTAILSATYGGRTGSASATINTATLSSVSLSSAGTLPAGATKQLTLNARYSNSISYNVTHQATFRSASIAVASVGTTGTARGLLKALTTGNSVITATFGGRTAQTTVTVSAPTLTGLTLSPATLQLPKGLSQQLTTTARYSDNSTRVVTNSTTFSSSNTSVASVSTLTPRGVVTAKAPGRVTITATFSGRTATCVATVVNATVSSIRFEPAAASLAAGTTQRFLVRAIFSDSSQQDVTANALLSLQSPTIAEFTATRGEVRGLSSGRTNVNASYSGRTASASLNVTPAVLTRIDLTPNTASFPKGTRLQFTATGVYSDGRTQNLTSSAQWNVAEPTILAIDQAGLGEGLRVGTTSVSATSGGKTGTAQADVTAAVVNSLSLSSEPVELPVGLTQQLTVTAHLSDSSSLDVTSQASYEASSPDKISVSEEGEILALATGQSNVVVRFDNIQATLPVTVTGAVLQNLSVEPAEVSLPKGLKCQFSAAGRYSDGSSRDVTASVLWSSKAPAVAEIDATGLAVTLTPGESEIQATLDGKQATSVLSVRQAEQSGLEIVPGTASLTEGQNLQLAAYAVYTDGTKVNVTNETGFTSSQAALATVVTTGPSRGLVRGRRAGQVAIEGRQATFVGQTTLSVQGATSGLWPGMDANGMFTAGESVTNSATGDLDGDGDLDVATSDAARDRIGILLNDGSGGLGLPTYFAAGNQPGRLVACDADGDGDLDLAVAQVQDKAFRVFFNDGRGHFTPGTALPFANSPQDLAIADVDGDGDLDVAVALYDFTVFWEPIQFPILLNDGAGNFSLGSALDADGSVRDLEFGDVDADGDMDLLVGDESTSLQLRRNNGNGQFSDPTPALIQANLVVYEFKVADMDNDGYPDIVAQGYGVDDINGTAVCLNDGSGGFAAGSLVGVVSNSTAVGDIDGDGDTDVVSFDTGQRRLLLLLNNGQGQLTEARGSNLSGYSELSLADVDGDGFLDVLAAGVGGYSVAIFKNDGRGNYPGGASLPVGSYPITMTSGDFDGDGRADTAVANRENTAISVITNPADAEMSVSQTIPLSAWPHDLESADLNGDGYRDLIVILRPGTYGQWASSVAVFFNQGQAQFASPVTFSVGNAAASLDLGDIDGDGDLDLAVANGRDSDISIFRNNGAGGFSDRVDLSVRYPPNDISFGDADKDGDLDLVAGTESSTNATLFFNGGTGTFGVGRLLNLGFNQPRSMKFADPDEDGDNDLLTRDVLGNRIGLLLNDGTGSYSGPTFFPTSPRPSDLEVTDMNLDGNLDVVLACDSDAISVLLGDGAGQFAAPLNYHAGDGCNTLSVQDFDLDGDTDIATALYREHRVAFLKNKAR
jgi:hypothetical protein